MLHRVVLSAIALAASALLAGCAAVAPPLLQAGLPAQWRQAPAVADAAPAPDLRGWWRAFCDPLLDGLVEQLLQQNLGLAQARSRLRQARLLAARDGTQYLPVLSAGGRPVQDAAAIDTYYRSSLEANWELSLYGERESMGRVAQARIDRALAEGQGAQVAAVAELVRQVLLLRAAQAEARAGAQLLALDRELLALQRSRRALHLGLIDDERGAQARLAETERQAALPRHGASAAAQSIAVLLGRAEPDAAWLQAPHALPPLLLPGVAPQLPAELLRTRADVQAAEAEVQQAAGELGLARAELYPRIALGAAFVSSYNLTQNRRAGSTSVTGLGPVFDIPLFDWGRRRANAAASDAALTAAVYGWRQAVVTAAGETETALSALALAREQSRLQEAVVQRGQDLQQRQAERAGLGLASAQDRLLAQRDLLVARQALAASRQAAALAVVGLYRALGGAPLFDAAGAAGAGPVVQAEARP